MSSLNPTNLPYFLYEQSNSIPVIFEQRLYVVLSELVTNIKNNYKGDVQSVIIANKVDKSLNMPTNLKGILFEDRIRIYGNGNTWNMSLYYDDFVLTVSYNFSTKTMSVSDIPEYINQASIISVPNIEFSEDVDFAINLYDECLRYLSQITEVINHITYKNRKLLPDFYYTDFPNSLPILAEQIINQVVDDVRSFPINNWSDLKTVQKEFYFERVYGTSSPVLNIQDVSLLRGLFSIKGTEAGLKFLLKYFGIEVIVYYSDDIKALKLVHLPDNLVTECDITLDISLGKDMSLGVTPDGKIDYDYDSRFLDMITKIMSVCLNILAIAYTKHIEETWYWDNPIQGRIDDEEENLIKDFYTFKIPENSYICPSLLVYNGSSKYGDGHTFYPTYNPLESNYPEIPVYGQFSYGDWGVKYLAEVPLRVKPNLDCIWYAPSKITNNNMNVSFSSSVAYANEFYYGSGVRYTSSTKYQFLPASYAFYGDNYLTYDNRNPKRFSNPAEGFDLVISDEVLYSESPTIEDLVSINDQTEEVTLLSLKSSLNKWYGQEGVLYGSEWTYSNYMNTGILESFEETFEGADVISIRFSSNTVIKYGDKGAYYRNISMGSSLSYLIEESA